MADKNNQKPEKKTGFFKGVQVESKRVTWYPTATAWKNTAWLIAILTVLAAVIGLVDVGLMELIGLLV